MRKDWMTTDAAFAAAWMQAKPFTMTSPERGYALWRAVEHLGRNNIEGALVECGAWRGGSAILMALAANRFGLSGRKLHVFDTFNGMTEAGVRDQDLHGRDAGSLLDAEKDRRDEAAIWAVASLESVRENFKTAGLTPDRAQFIEGDVRETLKTAETGPIALLRLDTDFYDSTYAELQTLYPRLSCGGVLLVDDFGHWKGARAAVEAYFTANPSYSYPLLTMVDYTGAIGVKTEKEPRAGLARLFARRA